MALYRGVEVDQSTIHHWVVKFSPDLEKSVRKNKSSVGSRWRMDETYIKVKGQWKYLYRAVDKEGQVEQDHRFIKQLCRATLGFQSFRTAKITLSGFECMKILNKKQTFSGGKSPARHFCALIK